jgi:tRNA-specific 2-thiouridylase
MISNFKGIKNYKTLIPIKRSIHKTTKNHYHGGIFHHWVKSLGKINVNKFSRANKNIKVFLALSSGVDSTMAGYLMMQKFPNLNYVGVYLNNWDHQEESGGLNSCPSEREWAKVQFISQKLNIPSIKLNFIKNYWNSVFEPTLNNYQLGLTPNPDILCNKEVKFGVLWDHLKHYAGSDEFWLVTGHYATIDHRNPNHLRLIQGVDPIKDQTYYLAGLSQEKLKKVIFPLGVFYKKDIKQLAKDVGFVEQSEQKESMGICFIGKRSTGFQQFLSNYLRKQQVKVVNWKNGKFITNVNIWEFTLGQRLRGTGLGQRWYVGIKDTPSSIIMAVNQRDHPCMYTTKLILKQFEFFNNDDNHSLFKGGKITMAKVRSQAKPTKIYIKSSAKEKKNIAYEVEFVSTQRGLTPGQFIVVYDLNSCLIGCSLIDSVGLPTPKWYSNNSREV